jgi:hypothetical protein
MRKPLILLGLAFVGWALCGAIMGIGQAITSIENTLIIHAIGAPIIFAMLSAIYFKRFHYTSPLQTAIVFVAFVIGMDVFVIAMLVEKSFAMFASVLGTWIPFTLIFLSTYVTGSYLEVMSSRSSRELSR